MLPSLCKRGAIVLLAVIVLGRVVTSNAAIVFSNVTISGTSQLIAGASFATTETDIDFTFPAAVVGDFQAVRQGTISISYEATSVDVPAMSSMIAGLLGDLSGSGQIEFSETIEDLVSPGVIAWLPTQVFSDNSQLPFSTELEFSRSSTQILVTKDFLLTAQSDTQAFDLARVSLVNQHLTAVPEPATMGLLAIGLSAVVWRRQRKPVV